MGRTTEILAALLASCALTMPAHAQSAATASASSVEQAAVTTSDSGRQSYEPAFFAQFAPRNALDMLKQVPGFAIREGEQERGLGEASDNVLVNGERLASKSDSVRDQIQRIAADRVVRIEIVDGSTLDVPGLTGQVANIVTRTGGLTGQFEHRIRFRSRPSYPSFLGGEATVSGKIGNLDFTIALSNNDERGASDGPTLVFDGAGAQTETRDRVFKLRDDDPKLVTTVKWDGPGDSVGNFSAMYRHGYFYLRQTEDGMGPSVPLTRQLFTERWHGKEYELNADYEFALGPGRLKLIALEQYQRSRFRATSLTNPAGESADSGDRFAQASEEGERVARGEFSWKLAGGDWQLAAEAAFNRLDRVSSLGPLAADGSFALAPFPEGSGGVREDRYEVILSHGRTLAKGLTARLGIGGEYSKLAQTGPDGLARRFWRPKGSLTMAWTASRSLTISAKLERSVGQLNFGDFLGAVFLDDDNASAANAELVPPQSWEGEIETKLDLGKWGSTSLRLFAERTRDPVQFVPLPDFSGEFRGNIDKVREDGVQWIGTFNLDPVGWRGAKIEADVQFEKSSLRDPVTGLKRSRSFNDNSNIAVSLRHDVPQTPWAWSLGFERQRNAPYYRLRETGRDTEGPYVFAFVEHKDVLGATLKLLVFNINGGGRDAFRTVYAGPRGRSPVLFREVADEKIGPIFIVSLKGNF